MAEVIGLATSVLTLTKLLGVGQNALAKLKSCYNAPPEVARIRTEIERLAKLLASVEDFARSIHPVQLIADFQNVYPSQHPG